MASLQKIKPIIVVLLGLVAIGGFAGYWFLKPAASPIVISAVRAVPVEGPADGPERVIGVFLNLQNTGEADWLVAASTSVAGQTVLYTPLGTSGIAVPAGSTPSLAADGAHIQLSDIQSDLSEGRVFPITLVFKKAGRLTTRARVSGPITPGDASENGLFGLGDICRVGPGEPAPEIELAVKPAAEGDGWQVHVSARDFRFDKSLVDGIHIPGTGHGHLYLNGLKLQRLYSPDAKIGALPPGVHTVRVTLNTNDHRAYVVEGEPVSRSASFKVD